MSKGGKKRTAEDEREKAEALRKAPKVTVVYKAPGLGRKIVKEYPEGEK